MPRTARAVVAGGCYHVISRGNNRSTVFFSPAEYDAFVSLVADAQERISLGLLAACLMPNHFHLVVVPRDKGDVSRWIHWLLTTHGQHHHRRHQSCGRIWQGRSGWNRHCGHGAGRGESGSRLGEAAQRNAGAG